jgi:thiamine biosynthesis lipoprotein
MIREEREIMGMPIAIVCADDGFEADIEAGFDLFRAVDERFSTYKPTSEVSRINADAVKPTEYSPEMREVLEKCEAAKQATAGYFDIMRGDYMDPSGLVKGWSIDRVGKLLEARGMKNFFVDAGGDILVRGMSEGQPWLLGVRHPELHDKIVKKLRLTNIATCTSGDTSRGDHIYNPYSPHAPRGMRSITLVGPDIVTADVLATTAYAMGLERGLEFISRQPGYEAYAITAELRGLATAGFNHYESD